MKLRSFELHASGGPRPFLIDRNLARKVMRFSWKYDSHLRRAKATVRRGLPRVMLQKYVLRLCGLRWIEVYFINDNPFDCRIINLAPYRREEEGSRRRTFKNKRVKFKGVSMKSNGKYVASIRVRGKLKHLGYFTRPEHAADAYRKAYNEVHRKI